MKNIKNLLLGGFIALALVGCGGGGGGVSDTSKKISGVALKADGTTFAEGSVVLAVDSNGNAAEGTVGADGKYEVTLVADASSGKKSKTNVEGNSFLRVSDGSDEMDLVIAEDQTNINFNVVTSAASALLIGSSGLDLDSVFDAAEDANGKKSKGLITNPALLFAIAKVQVLTKDIFKSSATSVVGTLFGFDSNGKPTVNADKLLTGSATEREVTMVKAAAQLDPNLLSSAVVAANSGEGLNLLNSEDFFYRGWYAFSRCFR